MILKGEMSLLNVFAKLFNRVGAILLLVFENIDIHGNAGFDSSAITLGYVTLLATILLQDEKEKGKIP